MASLLSSFLILLFMLFSAHALNVDQTQQLWTLCRQNSECSSAFSLEAPASAGTTPLDNGTADSNSLAADLQALHIQDSREMLTIPQFRAFQKIMAKQCALREDPGQACSTETLDEQLPALQANPVYAELWLARMLYWVMKSGATCGFNKIITVDPQTGDIVCQCRLSKSCDSDNEQFLDELLFQVLMIALTVVVFLRVLASLWKFISKRRWWKLNERQNYQLERFGKFIQPPPAATNEQISSVAELSSTLVEGRGSVPKYGATQPSPAAAAMVHRTSAAAAAAFGSSSSVIGGGLGDFRGKHS